MNQINEHLADCARKGRGGIRQIWLGRRSDFGNQNDGAFWYLKQTANLQYGEIEGATLAGSLTLAYHLSPADSVGATLEAAPSRKHVVEWRATIPLQDVAARDVVETYLISNDLLMVYQDWAGVYWLVGEEQGLRVRDWTFGTGNSSGQNAYSIRFECVQRWPLRSLTATFVETLIPTRSLSEVAYTDGAEPTDLGNTSLHDLGTIRYN